MLLQIVKQNIQNKALFYLSKIKSYVFQQQFTV